MDTVTTNDGARLPLLLFLIEEELIEFLIRVRDGTHWSLIVEQRQTTLLEKKPFYCSDSQHDEYDGGTHSSL